MPRNGSGVYSADWVNASPNTTIESAKQNAMVADLVADANAARPVTAGGTGETTARLKDGTWRFQNTADQTKLLAFDLSGLTTGTTRTVALPDESARMALAPHLAGHIYGLNMNNNAVDSTNDIDIAVGSAIDSANTHVMTLASVLTKRSDAAWAAGTNQGGRFHATLVDGTLHWYLVKNPTTGVVDVGCSDNATNPTAGANYPAGFTLYRRIGSVIYTGGIKSFLQDGDNFWWVAIPRDVYAANPGTSAVTRSLTVPTGIQVVAVMNAGGIPGSNNWYGLVSSLSVVDATPSQTNFNIVSHFGGALSSNNLHFNNVRALTNTSGQVRSRLNVSGASDTLAINTLGYVDARGKNGGA